MHSDFFDTVTWFQEQTKNTQEAVVVYGGTQNQKRTKGNVIQWQKLDTLVRGL